MNKQKYLIGIVALILTIMAGCSQKPWRTGFLSTYANLEPVSSDSLRYSNPAELRNYSQFIIDPIVIKLYEPGKQKKIDPKDLDHLKQYFYKVMDKALSDRYQIVSTPGPGVARLRVAITDLKKSSPLLNIIPTTKLTGIGLGKASVEAELVDSQTGKQLAAVIDSESGSRLSFDGLTKWGDVQAVMNDWAKRLRKHLDNAHQDNQKK